MEVIKMYQRLFLRISASLTRTMRWFDQGDRPDLCFFSLTDMMRSKHNKNCCRCCDNDFKYARAQIIRVDCERLLR